MKKERCPRCNSVLEIFGRCGHCKNPDCTVDHVQFRPEFDDYLMMTDKRKGKHHIKEG